MFRYFSKPIAYLNSHIRFKIIFPFLVLTLLVAALGTYFSVRSVTESLDERFTRQLLGAGALVADGLTKREQLHLSMARSVAFTQGIDEAILAEDQGQLQVLLFPMMANDNQIDRVDVLDLDGQQLLGIFRPPGTSNVNDYRISTDADLSDKIMIQKVLVGMVDEQGDKYIDLTTIDDKPMLVTAGPIKNGDDIVGVVLVGSYVQDLLLSLKQTTFAEVSLYDLDGQLISSTLPPDNTIVSESSLNDPSELRRFLASQGESILRRSIEVEGTEYDLLYGIFVARQSPLALYSVGMPTSFMEVRSSEAFNRMLYLVVPALVLVFGIGFILTRSITNKLQRLMESARAVASGDFTSRTQISSSDEIGLLAQSLDEMTDSLANYTTALQDRIDELIALYDSSSAVTIRSSLNMDHVLRAVTASVKMAMRSTEQVIIHLLDEQRHTLIPKSFSLDTSGLPPLLFGPDNGLEKYLAVAHPQIISTSEIETYAQGPIQTNGTTKLIITPLIAGQETIGMLTLVPAQDQLQSELLDGDKERLLSTLANQTAIAIKNAQLFEATQQAYEELRQLDDLKTEFINIAAHELRTPLGAMMGYASFAQKRVPSELQKTMDFLVVSSMRMRAMVDAMLTIQRLDAGKAFVQIRPINLQTIVNKTISDLKAMAELQGHSITVDIPDTLDLIEADPEKIDLILSNLLSNAIKFTPDRGFIEVKVKDQGDTVLISVSDNGVGIPAEEQERIFDRFYQVPVEHIGGHGGMGIGLTAVKHLVELHQGQVWVESEVRQGSTFFVQIPKIHSVSQEQTPAKIEQPSFANEKIDMMVVK
jgi:signal transduction histidine kinase/HAMP domain-containing protein/sensor domain CHASE-containing protein